MRAIHIIPDTSAQPWIEALRRRFDVLAPFIPAHVTLVFPFDLQLSDQELIRHCREQLKVSRTIKFTVGPPEKSADNHFWLPADPIPPELLALRNALHTGALATLNSSGREYRPHITVARPPLGPGVTEAVQAAADNFPALLEATAITIERILDDQRSEVIEVIALDKA